MRPLTTQEPANPEAKRSVHSSEALAVLALAMSAFVLNLNTNVMGALLPFLGEHFDLSDGRGSWLIGAAGLGSALGALGVADVCRWVDRRTVLHAGLLLFCVSSLAHLMVSSYELLFALRLVSGFASGLSYAVASAVAADMIPYERRGAAMGRFNAGMFLAIPVGLPLTVLLVSVHWSATFALQALVGVAALVMSARCVPAVGTRATPRRLPLLRDVGVVMVLLATMLHVGSFFVVVQLATSWLDRSGLVPKEQQIWVWVGLGALSVVGSAAFGRFADRVGKRVFVIAMSSVLVACFVTLALGPGALAMLGVACALAISAAARTGPLQALVSGLVPNEQLGALMGLRGFCMQLGVALFAWFAGGIGDSYGFTGVLWFGAACQTGSLLAITFGVREPAVSTG